MNISAVLCVLNEMQNFENILFNINFLHPNQIIVVDGGSSDGTYEALSNIPNIQLIKLEKHGLLSQRLAGIRLANNELIFMFNADDNLESIDFGRLSDELLKTNAAGLTLGLMVSKPSSFWEHGWNEYFSVCASEQKYSPVLGRPCITYKHFFTGVRDAKAIFNEDTYLRYEQDKIFGKLLYSYSEQMISRGVPTHFNENFKQFKSYGISDSLLASNLKERMSLLYHAVVRIAFIRSLRIMKRRHFQMTYFTLAMGFVRAFYLLKGK